MSTVISAALVKDLRERTGAGMMECKKALELSDGDIERAIEELRKSGATKAGKKAGRIAAEGAVAIVTANDGKCSVMIEVNSETDFVARDVNFVAFVNAVAQTVLDKKTQDVAVVSALPLHGKSGQTVEEARLELVTKVGENIQIRRIAIAAAATSGIVGSYIHGNRIGVMVQLDTDNLDLARDIAMHIAASRPLVVSPDNVPQDVVAKAQDATTEQLFDGIVSLDAKAVQLQTTLTALQEAAAKYADPTLTHFIETLTHKTKEMESLVNELTSLRAAKLQDPQSIVSDEWRELASEKPADSSAPETLPN